MSNSFPVNSFSGFFSSFDFEEIMVLRSKRRYSAFERRSSRTYGQAFFSIKPFTFKMSLADSLALAAASAGDSG